MEKRLVLIVLVMSCSIVASVLGQDYYTRPAGQTYGTGDGLSYENAFSGLPDMTLRDLGAGDTLYVCDKHTIDYNWYIRDNGDSVNDLIIRGDCPDHPGIIDFNNNPSAFGISFSDISYVTFRDIKLRNSTPPDNFYGLITVSAGTGVSTSHLTFQNITAENSGAKGFDVANSRGSISNIVFEDCVATDSYKGGFSAYGKDIDNVKYIRCKAINSNQWQGNRQGFSCQNNKLNFDKSPDLWTKSPANSDRWYIDMEPEDDVSIVYAMKSLWGVYQDLVDGSTNGHDETSIVTAEFYWEESTSRLWVNAGEGISPEQITFIAKRGVGVRNIYYYDCESYGTERSLAAGADGNGFFVDWFAENVLYERCLSHDNGGPGFSSVHGKNVTVRYSLFYNNGEDDLHDNSGSGLYLSKGSETINIYNNVFYHNNYAPAIRLRDNGQGISIINNIIKDSTNYSIQQNTYEGIFTDIIVDHNLIYGGDSETSGITATNTISDDPLFVDEANHDFHLLATSPAINTGVDVGLTSDFDGNPIVGVPDIGAFEFIEMSDCGDGTCDSGENCSVCPDDCQLNAADDNPCDGRISNIELAYYIDEWKQDIVQLGNLMEAIAAWKAGREVLRG